MIAAVIIFALAAVGIGHHRLNFIALGLFCFALAFLLQQATITIQPR